MPRRGYIQTPEHRAAISAALTGRTRSPEHCAAISCAKIGHEVSPETRAKISATLQREDVTYHRVHSWLLENFPKAGRCEDCGKEGRTEYAYLGPVGGHERDRSRYVEVCAPCHKRMDKRAA